MLKDQQRLKRYRSSICDNVNKNDVVVDIGTGTGILGYLCLKTGAKKVIGIEVDEGTAKFTRSVVDTKKIPLFIKNQSSSPIMKKNCRQFLLAS